MVNTMDKEKIFQKKYCLLIVCVLVALMLIGSFYDYQISLKLYNPKSSFGILFASYGQLPAMLCSSISGLLLIKIANPLHKVKYILSYIFGVLLHVFAILGITMDPMLYIQNMKLVISVAIAIILVSIVDIVIWKFIQDTEPQKLKKIIILLLTTMFLEIFIINIIKILWGRPRMRMISQQSQALFQPWWVIGSEVKEQLMAIGIAAEEFKSFPSGHTGNAACAILLGTLPFISNRFKDKATLLFFIGVTFTIIVAFSRIIMGAHFLTDVTVGMSIAFIIEIIMVTYIIKRD